MLMLVSCSGSGKNQDGIFPSKHEITLVQPSKAVASVRSGYHTFDREVILKQMSEDKRYADAVEQAKQSVAQLVSMSDEELRALIPPADTKRALMVHRKGCPVHGEVYPNKDFPDDGQGWLDNRPGKLPDLAGSS